MLQIYEQQEPWHMSGTRWPGVSTTGARRLIVAPVLAAWILIAIFVTSCDVSRMAFIRDERVQIVEPKDRSTVTLPMTLRWDVRDFQVTGPDGQQRSDQGYFAVFVDRPPIPPGKTLEWFARQVGSCGRDACGSVDTLEFIYVTNETMLTLDRLPLVRETAGQELHTVRIVLLDGTGARIGESAFRLQFNFVRKE